MCLYISKLQSYNNQTRRTTIFYYFVILRFNKIVLTLQFKRMKQEDEAISKSLNNIYISILLWQRTTK